MDTAVHAPKPLSTKRARDEDDSYMKNPIPRKGEEIPKKKRTAAKSRGAANKAQISSASGSGEMRIPTGQALTASQISQVVSSCIPRNRMEAADKGRVLSAKPTPALPSKSPAKIKISTLKAPAKVKKEAVPKVDNPKARQVPKNVALKVARVKPPSAAIVVAGQTKKKRGRPRKHWAATAAAPAVTPGGDTGERAGAPPSSGAGLVTPAPGHGSGRIATPDASAGSSGAPFDVGSYESADVRRPTSTRAGAKNSTMGVKVTFPERVHALVSYATENLPDVISWNESGDKFLVKVLASVHF